MQQVQFNILVKVCQQTIIIVMKHKSRSEFSKKLSLKIQMERIKRKISQEQLALAADLNRNTIGKLERGEVSPSIDTLERIANVFGIEFSELIDVSKVNL